MMQARVGRGLERGIFENAGTVSGINGFWGVGTGHFWAVLNTPRQQRRRRSPFCERTDLRAIQPVSGRSRRNR